MKSVNIKILQIEKSVIRSAINEEVYSGVRSIVYQETRSKIDKTVYRTVYIMINEAVDQVMRKELEKIYESSPVRNL